MKKRTKVGLIIAVVICGISLWQVLGEDHGVGVASVRWLPPEAHNITYIRNYLIARAEFDIEQEALERWCANRKMSLRKLGSGEHEMIARSLVMLEQRGVIPTITEPNQAVAEVHERQRAIKSFGPGDLFYAERWPNGGGYSIGYDMKEKRAYYRFSHH